MIRDLPRSLVIGGKEHEIYTDFRDIILICTAYNDPELSTEDASFVLLNNLFVDDISNIENIEEALKHAVWFIDGGKNYSENAQDSPKLMDWEQDYDYIISAVDTGIKTAETVLDLDYMHWWTFLRKFTERKQTRLDTLISIRDKLAKGKPLDSGEKEIIRYNRDAVFFKSSKNKEFEEEMWGD